MRLTRILDIITATLREMDSKKLDDPKLREDLNNVHKYDRQQSYLS
jgi:hypothetical protein